MCRERYAQCKDEMYRKAFLAVAAELLGAELPSSKDGKAWEPGGVGAAILALVCAHAETGEAKYLDRARAGAEAARVLFFDEGNPLPKMTSKSSHYESITRADTLMMALLQLHLATTTGRLSPDLRYNDR
jgi:rhamnogalacturonyl hydrolase YesR